MLLIKPVYHLFDTNTSINNHHIKLFQLKIKENFNKPHIINKSKKAYDIMTYLI